MRRRNQAPAARFRGQGKARLIQSDTVFAPGITEKGKHFPNVNILLTIGGHRSCNPAQAE